MILMVMPFCVAVENNLWNIAGGAEQKVDKNQEQVAKMQSIMTSFEY